MIAIVTAISSTQNVYGDQIKLDVSLALQEEYNDNIFVSETDAIDDFITTVSPALAFSQKSERSNTGLLGRLDGIYYADNDELNDIDQNFNARMNHWLDPRLNLSGEFEYIKDSRPDRDIETTGLVLGRFVRYRRYLTLSGEYLVSEKTASTLTYAYVNQDFDDPELADFDSHTANLTLTHRLSQYLPSTLGRFNMGYSRYDYPHVTINNYSGTIGASREITEKLGLDIDIGGRYTRQRSKDEDSTPASFPNERESGFTGQLIFSHKGEFSKQNFTLSHDVQAASGRNAVTERTALVYDISHRFTYNLRGSFKVGYYFNQADQGTFSAEYIDEKTLSIQPGVRFDIKEDVVLNAAYLFTKIRDEVANGSAKRNLIYMRLVIFYPFFE
ncbi:MAG: hypothetical protein JSU83_24050 [Deltaproteobacteria bacterium]|nr:MAG: hypothetical protein JSU83_24050 [Deltaproteobacteria bacterium]